FDRVIRHAATVDVRVVDVGNLEFASSTWTECSDDVEHVRVVHVYADDGVGTGRRFWLFADELQPLVFTEDWHTQVAQVRGLAHALEEDPAAATLVFEIRYVRRNPLAKNVVGKHHNDFVTIDESLA